MQGALDEIRLIEELAANAVVAPTVQIVDGWFLRVWPDAPFRRSNSVLPIRGDERGLEERLALVADFYRRRGLPVRYQISPAACPAALDEILAARGFVVEAPVFVQRATTEKVIALTAEDSPGEATVLESIDEVWLAAYANAQGDDPARRLRLESYARLLERLGPRSAVASVNVAGMGPVAVGFTVVERGWAGIFSMATRPDARRRGAANAVLKALARHALGAGASSMYLQVEEENVTAQRLYARAGFTTVYRYHYRSFGLEGSPAGG